MKPSIKEIDTWLEEDPFNLIGIYDQTGRNYLIKKINNSGLIQDHGGFFKYLESLYNRGVTTVYIEQKRKRGESTHQGTASWEYHLKKSEDNTVREQQHSTITPGLNGGAFTGLSGQAYVNQLEAKLKSKRDKCKNLKRRLKEYENSPGLAGEIIETVKDPGFMEGIATIITALKPEPKQIENTNVETSELSGTKKYFINLLKEPKVTDDHASLAFSVLDRIMKGDQAFTDLVVDLIKTP